MSWGRPGATSSPHLRSRGAYSSISPPRLRKGSYTVCTRARRQPASMHRVRYYAGRRGLTKQAMGERIQVGYLARGVADLSVVVLHESYGLFSPLSNVPEVCDRLAATGFQSLAPDLYHGRTAATVDESLHLMAELQESDALACVKQAA